MVVELRDPLREDRNLYLWGARIRLVEPVLRDQAFLDFLDCQNSRTVYRSLEFPRIGSGFSVYASPKYPTSLADAEEFVASMKHGTLVAVAESGYPQVSILPFVKTGDEIEIHLHQRDPTLAALDFARRCTFLVSDF